MKALFVLVLSVMISVTAMAEGKGKGGDGFRKAAVRYEAQAAKSFADGKAELGRCLSRMAAIKRQAAQLADEGKWKEIDWTEYHQLAATSKATLSAPAFRACEANCANVLSSR